MCQKRNYSFVILVMQMRNIAFGTRDGQLPFTVFENLLLI